MQLKQLIKMLLQNVFLPVVYRLYAGRPVEKGSVLFADAHHEEMPFAMQRVYEQVTADGTTAQNGTPLRVQTFIRDFGRLSFVQTAVFLLRFMKAYATAETVFICDYFLPVASCRKRQETTVIQLWHSCGLLKKIGHDAREDVPAHYRGDLYGNYSYLTLSAPACIDVHAKALSLPAERIRAVGVSRTDCYFDNEWNEACRRRFYEEHPEAVGKKIALWAPTFRGNAGNPRLEGLEDILRAREALSGDWFFIIKAHPHIDAHGQVSNCRILTEELLPVTDVLITDYSSILFDYLIYERPAVLFAPDLQEYEAGRGFYIDYRSLPFEVVTDGTGLPDAVKRAEDLCRENRQDIHQWRVTYTGACDGKATERILRLAGLRPSGPGERRKR